MGTLKETRIGRRVKAVDGTDIPTHNFVYPATNPRELTGEYQPKDLDKNKQFVKCPRRMGSVGEDNKNLIPKSKARSPN